MEVIDNLVKVDSVTYCPQTHDFFLIFKNFINVRKTERDINLLFLLMHSLIDSCMCQGLNPQP